MIRMVRRFDRGFKNLADLSSKNLVVRKEWFCLRIPFLWLNRGLHRILVLGVGRVLWPGQEFLRKPLVHIDTLILRANTLCPVIDLGSETKLAAFDEDLMLEVASHFEEGETGQDGDHHQ